MNPAVIARKTYKTEQMMELATFYVGDSLYGIDILRIQEINRNIEVTRVPRAPDYVLGVLNLRGRIVTVLDLGRKLGVSPVMPEKTNRNIIVEYRDEHVGLLVDRISDVLWADAGKIEPAPANIGGVKGRFFKGVFKTETSLIGVLDIDEVFSDE